MLCNQIAGARPNGPSVSIHTHPSTPCPDTYLYPQPPHPNNLGQTGSHDNQLWVQPDH